MALKFLVAAALFVAIPVVAFAQSDKPNAQSSKPTIEEAQKLVETITGDKEKLKAYCEIANFSGNTQIVGYTMLSSDGSMLLSAGASLLNGQTFQSAKFDLSKVSPSACTFTVPVKRGMRASLVWVTGLGTNDERVATVPAH